MLFYCCGASLGALMYLKTETLQNILDQYISTSNSEQKEQTNREKYRRYPGTCPGGNEDLNPNLGPSPWHTSIHYASITTIYHHAIK